MMEAVCIGDSIAVGISSLMKIPRSEDPEFHVPIPTVVAVYPGADPVDIERLVVDPIEDALNEIDDVKHLYASADDSLSVVQVEFDSTVDVDKKYDEVSREIAALRPKLPAGVTRLEVKKINPGLVNIVQIALVSETASYARMAELAEALEDRLEGVAAVA